jgi:hypothetical protein
MYATTSGGCSSAMTSVQVITAGVLATWIVDWKTA